MISNILFKRYHSKISSAFKLRNFIENGNMELKYCGFFKFAPLSVSGVDIYV